MRIHWHRRDLRVDDNRGLSPRDRERILPVFVVDPAIMRYGSPSRVAFLLEALESLRSAYRDRGSDLLIEHGDPLTVLSTLVDRYDVDHVSWNVDYSGLARRRDSAAKSRLAEANVETTTVHDAVVHPPGEITPSTGEYYQVFSYFSKQWRDRPTPDPVSPPPDERLESITADPVPALADLGFEPPDASIPAAGSQAAVELLNRFCDGPIYAYANSREMPADDGTSRLSPHLRFGTIGIRRVLQQVDQARRESSDPEGHESASTFLDQLAWRDFFVQLLWQTPSMVAENAQEFSSPIQWRDDPDALRAWKRGATGYPLVDAGMRQLRQEAWMHNRVRMVVASFLTKDLLIDWRRGYEWFRRLLVDHDPANNAGGWQWAASTGRHAQPYFRIINPATQCARFDPDGEYVRRYVPELADAPATVIHEWPSLDPETRRVHAPAYTNPIVDHSHRRELALETFERARGDG